jgi:hypothetical protein
MQVEGTEHPERKDGVGGEAEGSGHGNHQSILHRLIAYRCFLLYVLGSNKEPMIERIYVFREVGRCGAYRHRFIQTPFPTYFTRPLTIPGRLAALRCTPSPTC